MAHYNIKTGEVVLTRGKSSLYEHFHERMHAYQHKQVSCVTLLHMQFMLWFERIPKPPTTAGWLWALWFAGFQLVNLPYEIECVLMTRKLLRHVGKWDKAASDEALTALLTYCPGLVFQWLVIRYIDWSPQTKEKT